MRKANRITVLLLSMFMMILFFVHDATVLADNIDPKKVEQQQLDALMNSARDKEGKTASDYSKEALSLVIQQKYADAVILYDKAIKLNPNSSLYYRLKGEALFMLGQFNNAANEYVKAAKLYPTSSIPTFSAALAYLYIGDYTKSLEYYNLTIDLCNKYAKYNTNIDYKLKMSYFGIGSCYIMSQDYKNAIINFDKALSYDSKLLGAYTYKAMALMHLNKHDEGIKVCDQALKEYPQFAPGYYTKGFILTKQGRFTEAFKQYNKALELTKDDPTFYIYRAVTYASTNMANECLQDLKKAALIQPGISQSLNNFPEFKILKGNKEYESLIINK